MLSVTDLRKTYPSRVGAPGVVAVRGVTFSLEEGEFHTLLGPSGCGKTTTLQCVAGLENPDSGQINISGAAVFSDKDRVNVPSHRRDIGMVFQSYAIWPHMSVFDNVAFPLVHGRKKVPRKQVQERVFSALEQVHLHALADRPAPFLSGGQQQRVALARALVHEPQLLLLDEPLSNLDAKLRDGMRIELIMLVRRLRTTALYVTHDQIEAMSMSDRITVMDAGEIVQQGTPREIYDSPRNTFVADFIGKANILTAKVVSTVADGYVIAETELGTLTCRPLPGITVGEGGAVAIRPESVLVTAVGQTGPIDRTSNSNTVEGSIELLDFLGDRLHCIIKSGGTMVHASLNPQTSSLRVGDTVTMELPADRCLLVHV